MRYVPVFSGCMSTLLSCSGTASALTPAAKNQNEWVTQKISRARPASRRDEEVEDEDEFGDDYDHGVLGTGQNGTKIRPFGMFFCPTGAVGCDR